MKRHWTEDELETDWRLLPNEKTLIKGKQGATRLGFAVLLKFFQYEGRFPSTPADVPSVVIPHLAEQVAVNPEFWLEYPWDGRATGYHRASIRAFCGYREATLKDGEILEDWLVQEVLVREQLPERVQECAFDYCRRRSIEPPGPERLKRIIVNAMNRQESLFCERIFQQLSSAAVKGMEALLQASDESEMTRTAWQNLKTEPGKPGLESIKETAARLNLARKIGLPYAIFKSVQPQVLERYAKQATVERRFPGFNCTHGLNIPHKFRGFRGGLKAPFDQRQGYE